MDDSERSQRQALQDVLMRAFVDAYRKPVAEVAREASEQLKMIAHADRLGLTLVEHVEERKTRLSDGKLMVYAERALWERR